MSPSLSPSISPSVSPSAAALHIEGKTINLHFADNTNDIDFADYFPYGIKVNSITLVASASTDVMILRNKNQIENQPP
jgi:hypothetical protein